MQSEVDRLSRKCITVRNALEAKQAEIERLRGELAAVAAQSEWRAQEIERLTDLKRTCECSENDQCMFARERDEARTKVEQLITNTSEVETEAVATSCSMIEGCKTCGTDERVTEGDGIPLKLKELCSGHICPHCSNKMNVEVVKRLYLKRTAVEGCSNCLGRFVLKDDKLVPTQYER